MMQQSSPSCSSSSSASPSLSCTRLQNMVSCKKLPKSDGCSAPAQRPLPDVGGDKRCCHGATALPASSCFVRGSSADQSSREELDCPLMQCNKRNDKAQAANGDLDNTCAEDAEQKTPLKPWALYANPNCAECPDGGQLLEEGEGESHGSSVNGSASLLDASEESTRVNNWRRLAPATAASCFWKDMEEEQEYFQQVLGSSSHGWTDEKHSSYLDSMEAEFLRNVMFKGRETGFETEPSSELDDSASSHLQAEVLSKEFKVCQSGKWRPVLVQASFVKVSPLKQLAVAVRNPWIKRFRASRRPSVPSLVMEGPLLEETISSHASQLT